jgi:hypothetical protein
MESEMRAFVFVARQAGMRDLMEKLPMRKQIAKRKAMMRTLHE